MKKNSKIILLAFLFIGMLFTCLQYTIIHIAKGNKTLISNSTEKDDTTENSKQPLEEEDAADELEKEIEDDYILSYFYFSFQGNHLHSKTQLIVYEATKLTASHLNISTPPPKM